MHVYITLLFTKEKLNCLATGWETISQQIGKINYANPYTVVLDNLLRLKTFIVKLQSL